MRAARRRRGSVLDEDDFEEAARLRDPFSQDAERLEKIAIEREAIAKLRMQQRRFKEGLQGWRRRPTAQAASEAEAEAPASGGGDSDPVLDDAADVDAGGGMAETSLRGRVSATAATVDEGRLAAAEAIAGDAAVRRRCGARQLASAAAVLRGAGQHSAAADLLYDARAYGIETDVLNRRTSIQEAEALLGELSVQLGVDLQAAGRGLEAWRVLLEACAEEPRPLRWREAVELLAEVAIGLARPETEPAQQVELLQGVVDAEVVESALSPDKWDELRLTLAMSLQQAGFPSESRDLLITVARKGSSTKRRGQAEWVMDVQDVDLGDSPAASSLEMRKLWDAIPDVQHAADESRGRGAGGGGRATARPKAGQDAGQFYAAGLAGLAVLLAALGALLAPGLSR